VYVIDPKGYSITHSQNMEMEKANKVRLIVEAKEATAYVEDKGKTAKIETESIILEGSPAEKIIDFAEKNDIDLIVMGTQGNLRSRDF
jgi:nucleotide-binding universal stress UspA family protein